MVRIVLGLIAVCLVSTGAANADTLIYGSVFTGPDAPSVLWEFAPNSGPTPVGIARRIGDIGFRRVGSLDFSPGGTLYGVGSVATTHETVLITINTTTAAGTLVGSLGLGDRLFQDIAFRPSDGTLFGFATGDIYTINITTGAATLVGSAGIGFPFGNSLAFQGTTLYYANESSLFTIDQATGVATFVRDINYPPAFGTDPRPPAMKFDPVSGTLWASVLGGFLGNTGSNLGTINPATGQTTVVRSLPPVTDGIAVTSGPPFAVVVPTLSEWAQMAMITVLILVGLEALRRRRATLS